MYFLKSFSISISLIIYHDVFRPVVLKVMFEVNITIGLKNVLKNIYRKRYFLSQSRDSIFQKFLCIGTNHGGASYDTILISYDTILIYVLNLLNPLNCPYPPLLFKWSFVVLKLNKSLVPFFSEVLKNLTSVFECSSLNQLLKKLMR